VAESDNEGRYHCSFGKKEFQISPTGRSSAKKRVWVSWPPRLMWKASMTSAKPSRTVALASVRPLGRRGCGPAGVQELALGRRALPGFDLQVIAEGGRVRNR
jgi:hypothetical protein